MAISSYLREYATRAAGLMGGEVEASITMREHGLTLRGGSSAPDAARCDRAEAMTDDGPCIDAMTSGLIVNVPSVDGAHGWQAWREQTMREGFVKALALSAEVAPGIVIALNLYSRSSASWDEETVRAAGAYARLIASGVRLQLEFADLADAASAFYRTMADTAAVERAVGAITHMNDCTEAEARNLLRSAATTQNVDEREIAVTILRSLVVEGRGRIVDDGAAGYPGSDQPGS